MQSMFAMQAVSALTSEPVGHVGWPLTEPSYLLVSVWGCVMMYNSGGDKKSPCATKATSKSSLDGGFLLLCWPSSGDIWLGLEDLKAPIDQMRRVLRY